MLKDLSVSRVANVSKGAAGLFRWIDGVIQMRIAKALIEGEPVTTRKRPATAYTQHKKTEGRVKDNSDLEEKRVSSSAYSANVHNSDVHNTFAQTAADVRRELDEEPDNFNPRHTYQADYDKLGYDWRLFRQDSPVRRRLLRERSADRKKDLEKLARNSVQAQSKVLGKVSRDPLYNSFSYDINDIPDMSYVRHKNDIEIDTAIQKERMKTKNLNKTKSRVSYHWSPKRRKEMKEESDYMTSYYTERFIKDVIKDIHDQKLTLQEGERYLRDFGYDLQVRTDTATGREEITAVKTSEEAESAKPKMTTEDENNERVLEKELMLGKDLIRRAAGAITEESLLEVASDYHLSNDDRELIKVFIGLLELINHGRSHHYPTWTKVQSELGFTRDWIHRVDDFERMIEHYAYPHYKVNDFKNSFTRYAQHSSNKPYVTNIREYLCEAFCLLDILNELRDLRSPKKAPSRYEIFEERSLGNKQVDEIIREHSSPKRSSERVQTHHQEVKKSPREQPRNFEEVARSEEKMESVREDVNEDASPTPSKEARFRPLMEFQKKEDLDNEDDEEEEAPKPYITIKEPSTEGPQMDDSTRREMRRNVVHSRSPNKQVTTKTWKKGGKEYKSKTTTYTMAYSPTRGKRTVVEKIYTSKGVDSPTKRMIDHKNASIKHKTNAAKAGGSHGKMLYTLDPKNAYLVQKDYPQEMTRDQIIKKTMDSRHGFSERYVDEDGNVVHKYFYSSPHAQKVKRGGRVIDATKEFDVSPSKKVWAQEFFQDQHVSDITSDERFETRKDFIRRMEERTKQFHDDFMRDSGFNADIDPSYPTDRAERYHHVLRESVAKSSSRHY